MFEKLSMYLQFPFVQYALIAGILIALCSSLLGVILVLKRFSFIGDGLSHVAFGAMTVAGIVGLTNNIYITLPVTIVCAIILIASGQNSKIKGDASVAIISVTSLALGYLFMNLFPTSSNVASDVCSVLFGSTSILTLTLTDVITCVVLSILVVACFIFFYNKIFDVTFDEAFATASGTKTKIYNIGIAVIVAVVIVLAMNLVGSLLISALIIFPALSAMRIFKSFKSVSICSAILSIICATIGILGSILWGTPVGSTIVAVDAVVFVISFIVGMCKGNIPFLKK